MKRLLRLLSLAAYLGAGCAALWYLAAYDRGDGQNRSERAGGTAAPVTLPAGPSTGPSTLRIGWTAWADAEAVTLIAARLIERHFDLEVERVMTDIGIQYRAVADGDLDIMLMAWLPVTHANYWQRVRNDVVNLGPIYEGRLGWVVPNYVPAERVGTLADLRRREVAKRMRYRIQGIDPGSGLMQTSERAMRQYRLDGYELVSASGAAMTGELDRAIRRGEWTVVTAWRPHWIFARYDLRFLDDPDEVLGGEERVHALARRHFQRDFPPALTAFFTRLYLPQDELSELLLEAQETSIETAVEAYLRTHPERVWYWLTGRIEEAEGSD